MAIATLFERGFYRRCESALAAMECIRALQCAIKIAEEMLLGLLLLYSFIVSGRPVDMSRPLLFHG
ncbi:MAG TPA: hypothetical protein VK608_07580 [Edaphobacter sp.]|nr:hypothetical protein [Edaphobacter sp.]